MPIELQDWSKKDSVEYHLVTPYGTDLGMVYDKGIGEDLVSMLNAACALRPQDWKLSDENVNRALAANQRQVTAPVHGIDVPIDGARTHYGAVVVFDSRERADLILTAVNAHRDAIERIARSDTPLRERLQQELDLAKTERRTDYWQGRIDLLEEVLKP